MPPCAPVEGRVFAWPVEGRAPAFPVEGWVPTAPVDGRAPALPVEGRAPTFPVEGWAPLEPHPRASLVPAETPPAPLVFNRLWSGCHFVFAGNWLGFWPALPLPGREPLLPPPEPCPPLLLPFPGRWLLLLLPLLLPPLLILLLLL